MNIKTKVTAGVVFLFCVILAIGGMGLYYVHALSGDAENIIKNNYETLQYTRTILSLLEADRPGGMDSIEKMVKLQEINVTEPGERELTVRLRAAFEQYKARAGDTTSFAALRSTALLIQDVNLKAIIRKNAVAKETASEASTYVVIMVSVFAILAFTFVVNFPGYIANPILKLTQSIKSIADKNYEERLHFDRKDEFEELAQAFNRMAEKLDEYEHSNLARVIFEKRRLETIINRMTDPVLGLDDQKIIVFANDEALSLLHITKDRLIGRYAPDVAVENDLLRTLIRDDVPAKKQENNLVRIVLAGKENYFTKENVTIRYTPTGEKAEEIIGRVLLLRNVTPYKELDLAKTNFIATISHELKTPIASLQMCTRLLEDTRVGDLNIEQAGLVKTMQEELARLTKITTELLDLAQVETGNIKLNLQPTDPRDILNHALDAVRFLAERKQVVIQASISDGTPFLKADADKTTWVLVNLLTNAIRYSREQSTVVVLGAAEAETVRFSVQDFGPGIEPKYQDKLFEKFFQVPGSPSGSGLGLAISREFIEAQGGSIVVKSVVQEGSTFSFRVPRA